MAEISNIRTPDGITWHVERSGSGPDLILVPSGEGDCSSYARIASLLAPSFRHGGPLRRHIHFSELLADQITTLMDALSIQQASFYGCSSGGATCLSFVKHHPDRVTSVTVHEVALGLTPAARSLKALNDDQIVETFRYVFANVLNEDKAAWEALGPEYHARLNLNYVTFVREYVRSEDWEACGKRFSKEDITKRPMNWTIGALTEAGSFFGNVVMACEYGIPIGLLPTKHFPQVSMPEKLADHIRDSAMKHLC